MQNDILDILPTPEGEGYMKIKARNPHSILNKYAKAVKEKYKNKLSATITESSIETHNSNSIISYSFYLTAPIGRGYFYKLIEITPVEKYDKKAVPPYPIAVKLFDRNQQNLGIVYSENELLAKLNLIFQTQFVTNLILNILAQVELYNENQNKNYE